MIRPTGLRPGAFARAAICMLATLPGLANAQTYPSKPVQLIVPTEDRFVRPQLFDRLQHWAPKLWRREVRAGHWQLLAEPQQLALWLREFIQHLQGDGSSRALQQAQVKANAGPYSGKLVIVTGVGSGIGRANGVIT